MGRVSDSPPLFKAKRMKSIVINLDHRSDRWHTAQKQLIDFGIAKPERFSAYSQPSAVRGNGISHYECLQNGYDLVFEDDIFFEPYAKEVYDAALKQLPDDWDILYLGGNVISPLTRFSDNLYRCTDAWGSFAILYSAKGREFILKHYNPHAENFIIFDEWLRVWSQSRGQAYICSPIICWTYPGFSDVNGYHSDYLRLMQKNANNHMK